MPRIIALFISAILLISGVGYVLYEIIKFLGISRMSRGRRVREMSALLSMLGPLDENAAPWLPPEIELLSARIEGKVRKKLFARLWNGTMQTVYGEPIVSFAARVFTPNQYISVWKTTGSHYGLISTGRQVHAYVNDQVFGVIIDGELSGSISGNGRIKSTVGGMKAIEVGDRDVAIFRPRHDRAQVTERFFEMVADGELSDANLHGFTLLLWYARIQDLVTSQK